MSDELLVEIEDRVAVLTINRPDSLNSVYPALQAEMADAMRRVAADSDVGCVVLTGAGRGFCAGGDTRQIRDRDAAIAARDAGPKPASPGKGLAGRIERLKASAQMPRLLHDMGKPTIAMINGACAGVGMSLAGACDLRFAGTSALMTWAYQKIGLSGDGGGTWYWTQILGTAKARRLILMNERFDGRQAHAFGLVHETFEDADLRPRTMEIAQRMAQAAPGALRYAKEALNFAEDGAFARALEIEAVNHALSGLSK